MTAKDELKELIFSLSQEELKAAVKIFQERFLATGEKEQPPSPKDLTPNSITHAL